MKRYLFQPLLFLMSLIIIYLSDTSVLFAAGEEALATNDIKVEEDAIVEPFPLRLTPMWWDTFSQANPENLDKQATQLKRELNLINTPEEATNLASQVVTLLDQYVEKRNTPLPVKESPKNAEKRLYFLEDIFQLIKQSKSIESDLQLLNTNQQVLLDEIKSEDSKLNQIKLVYLKDKENDTDKLIQGLKWIKSRLDLSLFGLNQKSLESQSQFLNEKLQAIKEEKKVALDLLEVTPKQVKDSRLRGELLADKIEEVKKALERLRSEDRDITGTDEDSLIQKRLLSLQVLEKNVSLRQTQSEFFTHQLIRDIDRIKTDVSSDTRNDVRIDLRNAVDHVEETDEWMQEAGNRIEKEENAINSQQALETNEKDKQEIRLRERALKNVYEQGIELQQKQEKLRLLTTVLDDKLGKTAQGAAVLVEKADKTLRDSWDLIKEWMQASLFTLSGTPVTPIGLLHFLVILFVGWLLSRLFVSTIERVNARSYGGMQASSIKTLSRIASFILVGIALLIGFSSLGIDVTKLALVASALSIGIGFGLQNIINNFVSGIILLFERSMKVGDYIELADGMRGEVREINIRSTVITTNNNIDVIVPNSEFVNNSVTNWTMNERFLRMKVPFSVAYGSDKNIVRRIITDAALALPYTLNITERQFPQVRLASFGESSLDFELVIWIKSEYVNRPGRIKAAYNWEIETILGNHNIEIPFPQREVRVIHQNESLEGEIAAAGAD